MKLEGLQIVGFRYGKAPEGGRSWNNRDHEFECGVSMAKVGYWREKNWSADTTAKKYYYIGTIAGEGGDGETCLTEIKQITYKEYIALRKTPEMIKVSNEIVNFECDRDIRFLNAGYDLGHGYTIESVEERRKKYLRKIK